jgi:hypothetical protein
MWIIENGVRMRPERPFYCKLVLMAEADSNSDWTGPLAWLGRPCWPPKVVAKKVDVQGHLLDVLHLLGACSNLGLGPKDI